MTDVPALETRVERMPGAADKARAPAPTAPREVRVPARTDVLVVGGGLAGATLAHHLAKAGLDVTLIERGDVNGEASGANSGSLHAQIPNDPFTRLGEGWVRRFAPTVRLLLAGIETWAALGPELGIDLEVDRTGGLVVARNEAELAGLRRKAEWEAVQGLESRTLDARELREVAPYVADGLAGGVLYPAEGKANPFLAAPALARAAATLGATVLTRTELLGLEVAPSGGFRALTSRGPVEARRVVNCAGSRAGEVARHVGLDLPIEAHPIQSSVTEPVAPLVGHLLYAAGEKLSLKQNRLGNILIGGGWDARLDARRRPVADSTSLVGNLRVALRVVPGLANVEVVRTWAAIVNGTADWRPLLGEAPGVPGFHLCFFPWMGFTAGPVVARAVGDLLLGREPEVDVRPFLL